MHAQFDCDALLSTAEPGKRDRLRFADRAVEVKHRSAHETICRLLDTGGCAAWPPYFRSGLRQRAATSQAISKFYYDERQNKAGQVLLAPQWSRDSAPKDYRAPARAQTSLESHAECAARPSLSFRSRQQRDPNDQFCRDGQSKAPNGPDSVPRTQRSAAIWTEGDTITMCFKRLQS